MTATQHLPHDVILGSFDKRRNRWRQEMIQFIERNRDRVDLSIKSGTFIGFHIDLASRTDGQLVALKALLEVSMRAQQIKH